jgi:hypothetical protein
MPGTLYITGDKAADGLLNEDGTGKFGDDVPRSVADIDGPESLAKVREWKRAQKAAKRDKQDKPLA